MLATMSMTVIYVVRAEYIDAAQPPDESTSLCRDHPKRRDKGRWVFRVGGF